MKLDLQARLLRFLQREDHSEQQQHRELRAQPISARVLDGECIEEAEYLGEQGGVFRFRVEENGSKFRPTDPVVVGDGHDLESATPVVYSDFDARSSELQLSRDPFQRSARVQFVAGKKYTIDRRPLGLQGRLHDAVRRAFAWPLLSSVLVGGHSPQRDAARYEKATSLLVAAGFNAAQVEAGAAAVATESLALIQGPPGTGKTRLLAEVVSMLATRGSRVALCAFTHRAVDNALLAIRACAPELTLIKLMSSNNESNAQLAAAGVQLSDSRRVRLPDRGVVAATCYQLAKLADAVRFHFTVFDEAGQLPIPHALPGMLRAQRWLFFGDHRQLPPVAATASVDPFAAQSIFELLHGHYGSHLLDTTYRMNAGVCKVVGGTFYEDRLCPSASAADRQMPFVSGGRFDEVLAPAHAAIWLRIDHRQPGQRSGEEANAVADLVEELVRRHRVPTHEIALIAPFRAQVRLLRSAVEQRNLPHLENMVIDTVERIQGQEREVVIVSLAAGDAGASRGGGAFHLSTNRINVALSRARSKVVLVASSYAFAALPHDPAGLRMLARCLELRDRLPVVDLTNLYCANGAALRGQ